MRRPSSGADERSGSSLLGMPTIVAGAVVVRVAAVALALPVAMLVNEARGVRSWSECRGWLGGSDVEQPALAGVGATLVVGGRRHRLRQCPPPGRAARMVDTLLVTIFGVPSTIVGVGLIALWNRPGPLGGVYGTETMLVLGYVARYLPVARW